MGAAIWSNQEKEASNQLNTGPAVLGEQRSNFRVLVADSTPMGTQLLAEVLKRSSRVTQVITCGGPNEVLEHLEHCSVEVAVLSADLQNETGRGFRLAQEIAAGYRETRVVMLLVTLERDPVVRAFRAHCRGVLGRTESVRNLLKCITCVGDGQVWAGTKQLNYLLEAFSQGPSPRRSSSAAIPPLTKRETTVVHCVTQALSNREIAATLRLSEHTVKNYMYRIFEKLGVSSRVELIVQQAPNFADRGAV